MVCAARFALRAIIVLMLAGCQNIGVGPAQTPVPVVGTPAGGPVATATATAEPVSTAGAGDIAPAETGNAANIAVGEAFHLNLPPGYVWRVQVGDPAVLASEPGDIYRGVQPGTTVMIADGDPVCRQATPPCGMPSRRLTLQVIVR